MHAKQHHEIPYTFESRMQSIVCSAVPSSALVADSPCLFGGVSALSHTRNCDSSSKRSGENPKIHVLRGSSRACAFSFEVLLRPHVGRILSIHVEVWYVCTKETTQHVTPFVVGDTSITCDFCKVANVDYVYLRMRCTRMRRHRFVSPSSPSDFTSPRPTTGRSPDDCCPIDKVVPLVQSNDLRYPSSPCRTF
jgi:hypothetical protein